MIKTLLLSILLFSFVSASHYSEATKMYRTGKYTQGLSEVKKGLKINSKDWKLFLIGGKIRTAMKNNKKAVANFELAHKYNTKDRETLRLLVKYSKKIHDKNRVNKYQKKLDALDLSKKSKNSKKVISIKKTLNRSVNFSTKEKAFDAIDKAINNGDYDFVYKIIKTNLKKFNKDSKFYYYAGVVRYERGQYKEAKINFNIALKNKMENYKSYYYLGMIFEKEEDWAKSSANYKIFRKYPMSDDLKKELDIKIKNFTDKKVLKIKKKQKAAEPKNVEIRLDSIYSVVIRDTTSNSAKKAVKISENLIRLNRFDKLTGELINISSNSNDKKLQEDIEWSIVNIYMFLKLYDKSNKALKSILIRYSNSSRKNLYKQTRANALSQSKNSKEAIPLFKDIIKKGNEKSILLAYNGIIKIYLLDKDYSRALKANYQKLNYLDKKQRYNIPAKIETLYGIANINFKLNKSSEAKKYLQQILAMNAGNEKYYKKSIILLGDLEYKGGDSKQALKYYSMYQNNCIVLDKYNENNSWVLFQIANCYRNLNNFDKAIDYYDNLIKNYPATDIWVKSAKWKKNDTIWQSRYQKKYNKILK